MKDRRDKDGPHHETTTRLQLDCRGPYPTLNRHAFKAECSVPETFVQKLLKLRFQYFRDTET